MPTIPYATYKEAFAGYLEKLHEMAGSGKLHLQEELMQMDIDDIIRHGLRFLGSFHPVVPLKLNTKENVIVARNPMLVYYYHNRLSGFDLERNIPASS
jgi:glycerol-3-phosphate O-acyltransferase